VDDYDHSAIVSDANELDLRGDDFDIPLFG